MLEKVWNTSAETYCCIPWFAERQLCRWGCFPKYWL